MSIITVVFSGLFLFTTKNIIYKNAKFTLTIFLHILRPHVCQIGKNVVIWRFDADIKGQIFC